MAVIALIFSLFAIVGAGVEVIGYGTLLLAAGLPVYFLMTRRRRQHPASQQAS